MITIFTPTYNRADKLKRVYDSLIAQTSHNFEWLIVDDGSCDNTESVVKAFKPELFPIRYYKKENGGKHTAYNMALRLAEGTYFLCLDSDDWLTKNAVELLYNKIASVPGGVFAAYKKNEQGCLLSTEFPPNIERANLLELNYKYNCRGEFTYIFNLEFARKYPFPTFQDERFITESVIYDRMSVDSEVVLIPETVTLCEYQMDGLTNNLNRLMKGNPGGFCLYYMQRIDLEYNLMEKIITAGKYNCFRRLAKGNKSKYLGRHKIIVLATKLEGLVFYLYYKIARGF